LYNESDPSNITDYLSPTITCPGNQTLTLNTSCSATLPDYKAMATVTDDVTPVRDLSITQSPAAGTLLNGAGITTVTLTVKDASGKQTSCTFDVIKEDKEPPVLTNVYADPSTLWPVNHKMRTVNIGYTVTDNCGSVSTTLSVTSNESSDGEADWEMVDNKKVRLRAERNGNGTGRIYTITITAVDASGNITTNTVVVTVPHNQSGSVPAKKSGAAPSVVTVPSKIAVRVSPNPTTSQFTISLPATEEGLFDLMVTDNLNRKVESRTRLAPGSTIYIGGNYRAGVYFVEVIWGTKRERFKLIKQ
jgi:hypothetical protein